MATSTWLPAELLRDPKFEGHQQILKWVDLCFGVGAYAGVVVHEQLLGITLVVEHQQVGDRVNYSPRVECKVEFTDGDCIKAVGNG